MNNRQPYIGQAFVTRDQTHHFLYVGDGWYLSLGISGSPLVHDQPTVSLRREEKLGVMVPLPSNYRIYETDYQP
jgi:hypothetical protein